MKTKTTLAALLLTAVMVTPSYGADEGSPIRAEMTLRNREEYKKGHDTLFLKGADAFLNDIVCDEIGTSDTYLISGSDFDNLVAHGYFMGCVEEGSLFFLDAYPLLLEKNTYQVWEATARYINEHPGERHVYKLELIRRAIKEMFLKESTRTEDTKSRLPEVKTERSSVDVARDGNL
jgi:hypothetical protein